MQKLRTGKQSKTENHLNNPIRTQDEILNEIAILAKIDDRCRASFQNGLSIQIDRANESARMKGYPPPKLSASVKSIHNALNRIEHLLVKTDAVIIDSIDEILSSQRKKAVTTIGDIRELKAAVSSIAKDVKPTKNGRPSGLRTPFDILIYWLIRSAHSNYGELKIYKKVQTVEGWDGSLLKSVTALRPLLNDTLLPKGSVGQRLYRIAAQVNPKPQKSK